MNTYNEKSTGGKGGDEFREKGKTEKSAPKYKDTYNPNSDVPKLKQQKGAE